MWWEVKQKKMREKFCGLQFSGWSEGGAELRI
jgi:hypothetical protein